MPLGPPGLAQVFSPVHTHAGADPWTACTALTVYVPPRSKKGGVLCTSQPQGHLLGRLELPEDNLSCSLLGLLRKWCQVSQTRRGEKKVQLFSWTGNRSEVHGPADRGCPHTPPCLDSRGGAASLGLRGTFQSPGPSIRACTVAKASSPAGAPSRGPPGRTRDRSGARGPALGLGSRQPGNVA